ncbi:sialate O-acetylesterase [Arthrobacter woluwensis]|uniref:sialate O-acetylesterase n=1 Tax=Arthrobacter woluwensis TaxID=156980 RepID=UPI001AAF26CB|nr:sialate O-acetylesterase [Arthrobacter woluwensis]QTF70622.1 sialate O-acetylesterase [Arthrobacter woluwensis]
MTDYVFGPFWMSDPASGQTAPLAQCRITDPATGQLAVLKDLSGNPVRNPIRSGANSVVQGFVCSLPVVVASARDVTIPVASYKSLMDQALAAAASAAAAQQDGIVSSVVDQGTGVLRFTKRSGAVMDVGVVKGTKGDKGDQGVPGLPGVNAVANDTATAAQVRGAGTQTDAALRERYVGRTIHVVVIAGQSNAVGRGVVLNTALTDPTNPNIYQFGSKVQTLRVASEPLDHHDPSTGFGPGLQIARYMIDALPADDVIVLVPTAHGGAPLCSDVALAWRWGVAGNLTALAIAQTDAAIAAAKAQWPGAAVKVEGIFWVQGEQDGYSTVTAATYQADLEALIAGLRDKYGATVPFVMGQMLRAYFATGTTAQINWAHTKVAAKLPRIGFALSPTEQNGDNVHYSAAGQRKLAAGMFAEWARAKAGRAPTVVIEPPPGTVLVSDDFERADGPVGSNAAGQAWVGQAANNGVLIQAKTIGGNLGHDSTTGAWSYWTLDTGCPNYTVQARVGAQNSSRVSTFILKYVDSSNWVALYLAQTGGVNKYRITGLSGGITTTVFDSTVNQASGDLLKAKVVGDTVTVWAGAAGDVLVGTYTMAGVVPQGTRVGFGFHPSSANTWADITVTA